MNKKQILLINDMAGYGKVATAAMLPILSYMGLPTYNLPTALVSNTLDYGKFNILDTTDYIMGVFPVWSELGFTFDAIATGFIASERQAQVVAQYCREQSAKGTIIFVDPIMGDEGKLYNGVTDAAIRSMKEMMSVADLSYPNYTEACYLTDSEYRKIGVTHEEACRLYFLLPYQEIPVHFPGTGDIFSAVLIGHLLQDESLKRSARKAMDAVYTLIDKNKDNEDKNRGIPLEQYLSII